jgi:hypothetical protein
VSDRSNESGDMLQHLRERFAQDPESGLRPKLTHWLADPLKPISETGHFRPSPVLLLLIVLAIVAMSVFLYFGYWAQ